MAIASVDRPVSAVEHWKQNRYDEVIRVTSRQLEDYPLDESALSLRGFAQFYLAVQTVSSERKNELLVAAIQDLRRALLLPEPRLETEIRYVLGKSYFHRGEFFYDSAVEQLQLAREGGRTQLDLLEYLAIANRDIGRLDQAAEFFREAIRLGDRPVHRVSLADVLIDLERYDDAHELLQQAIAETDDVTLLQDALLSRGLAFRQQQRYQQAIGVYEQLLTVNESSAEARFGLGEVYLALDDRSQARFYWREAIRLDPNHIESLQRLQEY
jgi:tetratricopeptide (TPR) repeat protein